MMFKDGIQEIGDVMGLKGRFLIDWGTDDLIKTFKEQTELCNRAEKMLRLLYEYSDLSSLTEKVEDDLQDIIGELEGK